MVKVNIQLSITVDVVDDGDDDKDDEDALKWTGKEGRKGEGEKKSLRNFFSHLC